MVFFVVLSNSSPAALSYAQNAANSSKTESVEGLKSEAKEGKKKTGEEEKETNAEKATEKKEETAKDETNSDTKDGTKSEKNTDTKEEANSDKNTGAKEETNSDKTTDTKDNTNTENRTDNKTDSKTDTKTDAKEDTDKKTETPDKTNDKEDKKGGDYMELSADVDNVDISLKAEKGAFPDGASLSVTKASVLEQDKVDRAVSAQRSDERNVALSYTFDIRVFDKDGKELQPAEGKNVAVSFSTDTVSNANLDTDIYHVKKAAGATLSAEALEVTTEGETATVETDGFSYYTVEFTYGDKQYVLDGKGIIKLSRLLEYIEITGNIESYEVSNDELFTIYMGDENDVGWVYDTEERRLREENGRPGNMEGGTVPYMVSLRPFQTEEWLEVRIDGITYRITVTDDINIGGTNVGDIDGVEQGDILSNFTANMPIATIWIDESKINMSTASRNQGGYATGGLTQHALNTYPDVFLSQVTNIAGGGSLGDNFIALNLYKASLGPGVTLPSDVSPRNHLEYTGDIAQFEYKNAATDKDGNSLDVYITYSNLRVNFQNNMTQAEWDDLKNNTAITLWSGNMADINGLKLNDDKDGTTNDNYGDYNKNQRIGAVWETHIQVKYPNDYSDVSKRGQPVDGTFYFPMVDIDVNRAGSFVYINNSEEYNNFSEQVTVYENSVDPSSAIYIPGGDTSSETNYYTDIERDYSKGWVFKPRSDSPVGGSTYDKSFYTGFMTLVNNNNGMHMENQFAGTGNASVETYFMVAPKRVSYQLKPTSITYDAEGNRIGCKNTTVAEVQGEGTVGGRVQTTQHGNKSGLLADGSGILNETTIATVAGQTIKYTLTPLPGYRLKGNIIINRGSTDYTAAGAYSVTPQVVTDSNGNPRYYTFEFDNIGEDNAIHAEWEPTRIKVTKNVEINGSEKDDTFKFRIRVWNPNLANDEQEIYSVKAFEDKKSGNRRYTFTQATSFTSGKKYIMVDGDGYVMEWDSANTKWVRRNDIDVTKDIVDDNYVLPKSCLFTFRGASNFETSEGKGLLQRRSDDALIADTYNSTNYDTFNPSSQTIKYDDAAELYRYNASGQRIQLYLCELKDTRTVNREYYDFETPNSSHPTVDISGYTVENLGNNIYRLSAPSGTAAPDFSALTGAGWTVLDSKREKVTFDLDAAMTTPANGLTLVPGTTDTYELELETNNFTKWKILNGIVPVGWSYEITEVGENGGTEMIGTDPGWAFVSKSLNASEKAFDGDEDVEFVNKRPNHNIKVAKKTVDNKSGTFKYRIKAWRDGDTSTYVDFSTQGAVDKGNGVYEFTLTVPGDTEKLFKNIPRDYKYEIQEFLEDRWEVVSIQRDTDVAYRVLGGKKYKVVVEDLDPKDHVTEEREINLRYKRVTDGLTGVETKEVFAVDSTDSTLLEEFFDVENSSLNSGQKAINWSKVNLSEITTGTRVSVNATLTGKDGKTYESGNVPATRTTSVINGITFEDLSAITPTMEINGHAITTAGGQISGDHFQPQTFNGNTYMRLRWSSDGKTNSFTSTVHSVDYNDTIVFTYPNAAILPNGTKKDVKITLTGIKISVDDSVSSVDVNLKGAIFRATGGPAVAAFSMQNPTPNRYYVSEKVTVEVDGASADQMFDVIYEGSTYSGNGANGATFNASITGNGTTPTVKPITLQGATSKNEETVESEEFKITVGRKVNTPNITEVTGEDNTYTVELQDGQVLTIPGGKKYKVYEIDEHGGETLIKDSATTSHLVTGTDKYSGTLNQGDVIITYTNEYTISLTAKKIVHGNLGSRDKYFKQTFVIKEAPPYTVLTLDMSNATTAFESGATMTEVPNSASVYSRNMILTGTNNGTGKNGNIRDDDNANLTFGGSGVTDVQKKALKWMSGDYTYKWSNAKSKYEKEYNVPGAYSIEEVDDVPATATHNKLSGQQIICDENGEATVVVYLQHDEKAVLRGMPYGAAYTLSEVNEDYKPHAAITGPLDTSAIPVVNNGDKMTDETLNSTTNDYEGGSPITLGDGHSSVNDKHLLKSTEITFTNKKTSAVPTEVRVPIVLGGLFLILASLEWLILRLRKRRREAYYEG
ncbi:MAG: hypothetical protein IKE52_01785 [Mogibacterium sp.]|nr:hypothetical protein [Mogibacterium sp.]